MPKEEHPEMHDPFFHPYGLDLYIHRPIMYKQNIDIC